MNYVDKAQRLSVKLPCKSHGGRDELGSLISVFQRWIQQGGLEHELMIDAVDYRHVPEGPGVMLVCQAGQYSLDCEGGALGLLYASKRDAPETLEGRLADAFARAAIAAHRLEQEPEAGLVFHTDRAQLRVHDRLAAPNDDATAELLKPAVRAAAGALFGDELSVERVENDPRACLTLSVVSQGRRDLATLASGGATRLTGGR